MAGKKRGPKPKTNKKHYANNDHMINMMDDIYLIALMSYLPLKHEVLIDKEIARHKKTGKKLDVKLIETLKRKRTHYEKWKIFYKSIDVRKYELQISRFYVMVNMIFKERIKDFKYSNWQYDTKNDAYLLCIEQIYKYFFTSYRRYKKRVWKYYNNYLEFEREELAKDDTLERDAFGLLRKPNNNPFSYVTSTVNTSMLNTTKIFKMSKMETNYFNALIEYDVDHLRTNSVRNFERDYIFNYDDNEAEYDNNNSELPLDEIISNHKPVDNSDNPDNINEDDAIIEDIIANEAVTDEDDTNEDTKDVKADTISLKVGSKEYFKKVNEVLDCMLSKHEDDEKNGKNKCKDITSVKFNDYINEITEQYRYSLDGIEICVSKNAFLQRLVVFVNQMHIRSIELEKPIINLLFCKAASNCNINEYLYYMMNNIDNDRVLEKILKNLDKNIVESIGGNFETDTK